METKIKQLHKTEKDTIISKTKQQVAISIGPEKLKEILGDKEVTILFQNQMIEDQNKKIIVLEEEINKLQEALKS